MLAGLVTVAWLGLGSLGGWDATVARVDAHLASAGRDAGAWWSPAGAGWAPIAGMVFSAAIHTPAASIYASFSTAARHERLLPPAFLAAGAVAAVVPLLGGFAGVLTLARFGFDPGLSGYQNITRLALELSPFAGGVALAAILAAVVSSGGPVLLSSATMFVRDWLPFTEGYSTRQRLRAYRVTTVAYGAVAALIAWGVARLGISVLDLLLFAYAMVVPPAIAVGFILYWRRTTEAGVFWGMVTGYAAGAAHYAHGAWSGHGLDPSSATTLVPLLVVPLVSLAGRPDGEGAEAFYRTLRTPSDAAAAGEAR
jgi:Na+/proline symporter